MKHRAKAHVFHLFGNFWSPSTSTSQPPGKSTLLEKQVELASQPRQPRMVIHWFAKIGVVR
jgi:hypothetical protein